MKAHIFIIHLCYYNPCYNPKIYSIIFSIATRTLSFFNEICRQLFILYSYSLTFYLLIASCCYGYYNPTSDSLNFGRYSRKCIRYYFRYTNFDFSYVFSEQQNNEKQRISVLFCYLLITFACSDKFYAHRCKIQQVNPDFLKIQSNLMHSIKQLKRVGNWVNISRYC